MITALSSLCIGGFGWSARFRLDLMMLGLGLLSSRLLGLIGTLVGLMAGRTRINRFPGLLGFGIARRRLALDGTQLC